MENTCNSFIFDNSMEEKFLTVSLDLLFSYCMICKHNAFRLYLIKN